MKKIIALTALVAMGVTGGIFSKRFFPKVTKHVASLREKSVG
jgi:hypothetical protein